MLYDPKWEAQDRIFEGVSLRALIAWLETKPANGRYTYIEPDRCALAQFLQETTGCEPRQSMIDFGLDAAESEGYWLEQIVNDRDMTFGGALERARTALTARQIG